MDRHNHYETAFAALLRCYRVNHVAVDESRRTHADGAPVKSLDFIVHSTAGTKWLVDVKGRRYPAGPADRPRRVWESWATRLDVDSSRQWCGQFGSDYHGLLVFSYHLVDPREPHRTHETLWFWNDQRYLLRAIPVATFARLMRVRSPRWDTVSLTQTDYRAVVRPLADFLPELRRPPTIQEPDQAWALPVHADAGV